MGLKWSRNDLENVMITDFSFSSLSKEEDQETFFETKHCLNLQNYIRLNLNGMSQTCLLWKSREINVFDLSLKMVNQTQDQELLSYPQMIFINIEANNIPENGIFSQKIL
jgi:hypothetical protein